MAAQAQLVRRLKYQPSRHGFRTIAVRVGPKNQTEDFTIYEDLIRAQSPFFDAAMRNEWAEAGERVVRLPEDDPASFEVYQCWIYSRTICSKSEIAEKAGEFKEWCHLGNSYILGEKLQDADFKDAIIDAILEKSEAEAIVPIGLTAKLYDGTHKGSLIRKLLVDMHVWKVRDGWFGENKKRCYNFESLFDIAAAFAKHGSKSSSPETPPFNKDRCLYHEHTLSGTPCYKTKG